MKITIWLSAVLLLATSFTTSATALTIKQIGGLVDSNLFNDVVDGPVFICDDLFCAASGGAIFEEADRGTKHIFTFAIKSNLTIDRQLVIATASSYFGSSGAAFPNALPAGETTIFSFNKVPAARAFRPPFEDFKIIIKAVPLPTTLPLLGSGLAIIGMVGWRRLQASPDTTTLTR